MSEDRYYLSASYVDADGIQHCADSSELLGDCHYVTFAHREDAEAAAAECRADLEGDMHYGRAVIEVIER